MERKPRKKKVERLPVKLIQTVYHMLQSQGGIQGCQYFVRLEKIAVALNDYHYFRIAQDMKKLADIGIFIRRKEGQYVLHSKLFALIWKECGNDIDQFPLQKISDTLASKGI